MSSRPFGDRTPPKPGQSQSPLPWVAVGIAAAAIRLCRLNSFSYWLDEILQVYVIRFTWGGMWRSLRAGVFNPPLDYSILKTFEVFHPSDAARRFLPVLWGSLSVVLFGLLISRRVDRRSGIVAAVLVAFAPYHVHYSQELRPYALGMLTICAALFALEAYLENPNGMKLAAFLLCSVAAAYTMYLAALVVLLAAGALVAEDSFALDRARRQTARRLALWSPVLASASAAAYLPWSSVFLRAWKAAPLSSPPAWGWERLTRLVSYFGFAPSDWYPLGKPGILFIVVLASGLAISLITPRPRFLAAWALGGLSAVELLEHRHGVYDSVFHFVPAGMALTGLVALSLGRLMHERSWSWAGYVLLIAFLALDARALSVYFQRGRPDWRPVAEFLRTTRSDEPICVDSGYTQLCLAYYVVGPDWFCCRRSVDRSIIDLEVTPTSPLGKRSIPTSAWLVFMGGERTAPLRRWSQSYPTITFPTAEGDGGVIVRHLTASHP